MPRNGSGVHSWPVGTAAVSGTDIESAPYNAMLADASAEITASINAAGTKPFAADQPMATYKLTGLGAGGARTDSVQLGQVQDGKLNWVAAGGTADVITATYSPAITALVDGQVCHFRASGANTTTPTFSPNGLTARNIRKVGGAGLAAGDIAGANHECIVRYNLANTRWELLNPATATTASTTEVLTGTNATKAVTPDSLAALWEAGSNVTDAAAITIGEGGYFNLTTSTTAITSFSITTDKAGRTFRCRFNTARTLTHNATSLILPGGADITTAQGDIAQFRSLGSGNVICEWYTPAARSVIVLGTEQASTSGTSIDFNTVPPWARRVTLMFSGVSTNGTSPLLVQLGDSGGFETTGYSGATASAAAGSAGSSALGAGFSVANTNIASNTWFGAMVLTNLSGNIWTAHGSFGRVGTVYFGSVGGAKTLSGTLDRVRITTEGGADAFDAGTINISYE